AFLAGTTEIALRAVDADEKAPRAHVLRVLAEPAREERLCVVVPPFVDEQRRLPHDVGLARTRDREREAKRQKDAARGASEEGHAATVVFADGPTHPDAGFRGGARARRERIVLGRGWRGFERRQRRHFR